MGRWRAWIWVLGLWACGEGSAPSRPAPGAAPAAAPPRPVPTPAATPGAPNPCGSPGPLTLEIEAGQIQRTPWGLELTFAIDEDAKLGPGYMFLLRSGTRRWETRRDESNWTKPLNWRGFCWRGGERPVKRASKVKIEMTPMCKDGQLQELGDCDSALRGQG